MNKPGLNSGGCVLLFSSCLMPKEEEREKETIKRDLVLLHWTQSKSREGRPRKMEMYFCSQHLSHTKSRKVNGQSRSRVSCIAALAS